MGRGLIKETVASASTCVQLKAAPLALSLVQTIQFLLECPWNAFRAATPANPKHYIISSVNISVYVSKR